MSATEDFARVLRIDADAFMMTVAVVAEREGRAPAVVALEALGDAISRLAEAGIVGSLTVDDGLREFGP